MKNMIEQEIPARMPKQIEINTGELWSDPTRNVLLDDEWAKAVGREQRLPTVRLWRHAPMQGLVVSKRDVAGERGEQAMRTMDAEGWPIIVRPTGGTAVPHGAGVLNLSLLLPRRQQKASTDAYYHLLCQPIIDWLNSIGLSAYTGALPGSYCDGNYNVLVDGKKLVGTAQAWRGGLAGTSSRHPGYVLAHACIMVDVNLATATEAMNRFYALIGDAYRVDLTTSTTLSELLRQHGINEAYSAASAQVLFASFLRKYYEQQGCDVRISVSSAD